MKQSLLFMVECPDTYGPYGSLISNDHPLPQWPIAKNVTPLQVGVFSRLTNSYCLVALGGSECGDPRSNGLYGGFTMVYHTRGFSQFGDPMISESIG